MARTRLAAVDLGRKIQAAVSCRQVPLGLLPCLRQSAVAQCLTAWKKLVQTRQKAITLQWFSFANTLTGEGGLC